MLKRSFHPLLETLAPRRFPKLRGSAPPFIGGAGGAFRAGQGVRSLTTEMLHRAHPWVLAALALPLVACGGATTSTPPGPQPLETDAGPDSASSTEQDASASDGDVLSDGEANGTEDAPSVEEEFSCPGWIDPDETASCSQNAMNNQCSASCRSGTRFWQSQCQDGTCTCSLGMNVQCSCEMEPGVCKTCCPGMAR